MVMGDILVNGGNLSAKETREAFAVLELIEEPLRWNPGLVGDWTTVGARASLSAIPRASPASASWASL